MDTDSSMERLALAAFLFTASLQDKMANPKEKTPMCLVNELARFNRVQPQYKLLKERGPAHSKMFSVQLSLGEQTWESEGSSIKKAQQAVANKALTESTLPKPVQKPPKSNVNNNPGSITPTVELNGLAMKRGEPAIYRPLDPKPFPNYRANYNFRGMYNQRYHCPVPKIFYVQLTVGNNEFFGEGKTRQAARHNAAMKALQALQNEPIPEKSAQNCESGKEMDDDKDANKSEISLVFEIALKRNMPVSFEVIKESGPPHMKSFVTRVSVGEFSAEGEGNSKKLSKKRAATTVLQELKKLPPLPVVEKPKLFFKKRPKTIVKAGPEYGQGMNPISRLAQIQQAKKEKEPDYVLLSERGMPRRREFVMQVKVGNEVATGTGPNKKIAKKNAAEAMLLQLGYKASTSLQDQLDKTGENKGWSGPKAGFPEPTNNTPKGILHLSPDVYQEMEASRHKVISGTTLGYLSPKDMNQPSSSFFSISPTSSSSATIARELLMNGTSSTAEAIGLKGSSPTPPCSPVQPSKQLEYLARIQGFQAALSALKQFSEQGLDSMEGAMNIEKGSLEKQAQHLGEKANNNQTHPGSIAQDCKKSRSVI
ncbi:double-stranded RNA-binding protein Staufen homolog 2 isoform X4 [Ovis aries]|nr:double-stranded RNA-binding protein Staufen homolog 2 isoform X4 [Ovis aries]XP_025121024.1 double-stranded RNA-binding protein Staufen homolog 2 isoform X5 [Bubalus bubalis]XP_040117971.1 double-stranded RNA-binding protein Staufen homolog 2 isoform X4 [Oryx dammah]XP_060249794.1 double-stranded RNA-binding protein Staufen homolog 2 isoform X4 [Ovis aries]